LSRKKSGEYSSIDIKFPFDEFTLLSVCAGLPVIKHQQKKGNQIAQADIIISRVVINFSMETHDQKG